MIAGSVVRADTEAPVGTLEGRIVEGTTLQPIEGATIIVTDSEHGPVVASGTTDPNGQFHYRVPPGTYDILAIFGGSRWLHNNAKVSNNKVTQVPGALAMEAEIVTIHETVDKPAHRAPRAVHSTVKPILPYSDQAIDENVWVVGWMLLDVDKVGTVTGFHFLHRPGYGLDKIAENEIWSLRFEPARDAGGQPMESKVLWKLEWPAFHYAKDHKLLGLAGEGALSPAMEDAARADMVVQNHPDSNPEIELEARLHGVDLDNPNNIRPYLLGSLGPGNGNSFFLPDGEHRPPCKGSGPMNLDMHEALYRDCTPPDLSMVNTEPRVERPKAP